ncbi:NupC/NupG family nucleoside CNT transporter [Magnetofaba australis]|nr:nucleoside transporter C-terminal domain-containing protein [Magnetofaba australis]
MLQSALGLIVLSAIAWILSEQRRAVSPGMVATGIGLQILLALALTKIDPLFHLFQSLNQLALALEQATRAGTSFVFGYLGGGPLPFDESSPGGGYVLAFRGLPLVLLVSALSALLFHWRILPVVVRAFSWALQRTLGVGGALGVAASANIFVGMTEAPLLIKPYLLRMSRSELFALMTCGMTSIAGTVMVLYASLIGSKVPDALSHILIASIISAPAAITIARIMVPDDGGRTADDAGIFFGDARGAMDAVTQGTTQGLKLLLNIVAMLVTFVALVSLANQILGALPDVAAAPLTLERILGWIMAPVTWLMGVPWSEATTAGSLMGVKTVLNEFVAYLNMAQLDEAALSPHSRLIMTYALCGFANFGSLGILIGGLGAIAPERRDEVVALGMKSLIAGTLGVCMTGAVIGLLNG